MTGGMLNKASRGELKLRLPVGFVYDFKERVVLDPDKQIQGIIRHLFSTFRRTGTVFRTVKTFHKEGIKFPNRMHHGLLKGDVVWTDLKVSRVNYILHNPRYIGAYVYGRRTQKRKDAQGRPIVRDLPQDEWHALIKDAHEGYISWEEYEENQKRLKANSYNRSVTERSVPREGQALLQGLVICGICGKRMSVRYRKARGCLRPEYCCRGQADNMAEPRCQSMPGDGKENITVHVRFKGGISRTLQIPRPLASWQEWTTDSKVVAEIDRLLEHHTNSQVASILN